MRPTLQFLVTSMKKRFWMLPEWEVDSAFETALEQLAPSRCRTSILREVKHTLKTKAGLIQPQE